MHIRGAASRGEILEVIKVPQEQNVDAPVPHVELTASSGEAGSSRERTALPTPPLQQSESLLVKLRSLVSQSTLPRQKPISQSLLANMDLLGPISLLVQLGLLRSLSTMPQPPLQQSQSLLVSMKLDRLGLRSTAPRQNPNSQSLLMKLGPHVPKQMARPAPPQQ